MKRWLIVLLCCALACQLYVPTGLAAEIEMEDPLKAYKERLEEFNEANGTSYCIAEPEQETCTGMTYEEIVDFYSSMSIQEFDSYISDLHQQNVGLLLECGVQQDGPTATSYAPYSLNAEAYTQKYYYGNGGNNANFFILSSRIVTVNEIRYYNAISDLLQNNKIDYYPYYDIAGTVSFTPSADSREVTAVVPCTRWSGSTIYETVVYEITIVFHVDVETAFLTLD